MKLTKDKRLMLIEVPKTRSTWMQDCLSEELIDINDMDQYEKNFGQFGIIYPNGKRREDWPRHSLNDEVSHACKLERGSYEKGVWNASTVKRLKAVVQ